MLYMSLALASKRPSDSATKLKSVGPNPATYKTCHLQKHNIVAFARESREPDFIHTSAAAVAADVHGHEQRRQQMKERLCP